MENLTEVIYNIMEALIITFFISMYFKPKLKFNRIITVAISFVCILVCDVCITLFKMNWIFTMIFFSLYLTCVVKIFYKGTFLEHLLVSVITFALIALINLCTITIMSNILETKYIDLVMNPDFSRFIMVLTTKVIFFLIVSFIIFLKKKCIFIFNKVEYLTISLTLVISVILLSLVRNIIYNTKENMDTFLPVILCVLIINIVQYFTMIYISKTNVNEKKMFIMKKQIEMQENNIHSLEEKYDTTSKLRHDIKNYILCALNMAERGNYTEMINYLKEISEYKLVAVSDYVKTERKVLGAVINSKLAYARKSGFGIQCIILSEMENVKDIDLGIMLANLLDNALEACEKNSGPSEIILKLWSEAGYYCLDIGNTVEFEILSNNPHMNTMKKNRELHGIGLKTVHDIVEKYNGIINFNQKANVFHVCISLENIL